MNLAEKEPLDVSIIMPCLNEEQTVGYCVQDAHSFLRRYGLKGEILVVDNNSEDSSARVARKHGAIVLREKRRGYGRAIRTGLAHAKGRILIFGDCDMTYDFRRLKDFYFPLKFGRFDMAIGNRLNRTMEKGAMSLSHRCGVPFLSILGRIRYRTPVRDFHCGLRSMTRAAARRMRLGTDGMEFATEMIAEASRLCLRIYQPEITLKKCHYQRISKLNTISDGLRHLRYMMMPGSKNR